MFQSSSTISLQTVDERLTHHEKERRLALFFVVAMRTTELVGMLLCRATTRSRYTSQRVVGWEMPGATRCSRSTCRLCQHRGEIPLIDAAAQRSAPERIEQHEPQCATARLLVERHELDPPTERE